MEGAPTGPHLPDPLPDAFVPFDPQYRPWAVYPPTAFLQTHGPGPDKLCQTDSVMSRVVFKMHFSCFVRYSAGIELMVVDWPCKWFHYRWS